MSPSIQHHSRWPRHPLNPSFRHHSILSFLHSALDVRGNGSSKRWNTHNTITTWIPANIFYPPPPRASLYSNQLFEKFIASRAPLLLANAYPPMTIGYWMWLLFFSFLMHTSLTSNNCLTHSSIKILGVRSLGSLYGANSDPYSQITVKSSPKNQSPFLLSRVKQVSQYFGVGSHASTGASLLFMQRVFSFGK